MFCVAVAERLLFSHLVVCCLPSVAQTRTVAQRSSATVRSQFPPLVVWLTPRVLADGIFEAFICGSGRMKESAAVGGFVEGYEI